MDIKFLNLKFESNDKTLKIEKNSDYKLIKIEGLESSKYEINIEQNNSDGGYTTRKRVLTRDIFLEFDYTGLNAEKKRQKLIKFFNPKMEGILTVNYCGIEKFIKYEVENFTDLRENLYETLTIKIDLVCPDPFWRDMVEKEINLVSWIPNLEFPKNDYIDKFYTEQTPNHWLETQEANNFNLINNSKNIIAHNCNLTSYSSYNNINTNLVKTILPNSDNNFGIKLRENIDISGKDGYFTLSFYYRAIEYNCTRNMLGYIEVKYKDSSLDRFNFSSLIEDLREGKNNKKWNRLEFSFKTNINKKVDSITRFYFHADFVERDTCVEITRIKLEQGNKATEYTCSKDESAFVEFKSEFGHGIGQEWGYRELKEIVEINNTGDVKCPIRVVFRASADVEKPYIQDVESYELIRVNKTLRAGDTLEITTGYGNKNVYLNGKKAHQYLDFLNSTWLELKTGTNLIKYGAKKGLEHLECTVFYTPLYLGV